MTAFIKEMLWLSESYISVYLEDKTLHFSDIRINLSHAREEKEEEKNSALFVLES